MALLSLATHSPPACKKHWKNQERKWKLAMTIKISLDRVDILWVSLPLSNGSGWGDPSSLVRDTSRSCRELDMRPLQFEEGWCWHRLGKVYVWRLIKAACDIRVERSSHNTIDGRSKVWISSWPDADPSAVCGFTVFLYPVQWDPMERQGERRWKRCNDGCPGPVRRIICKQPNV